MKKESLSKKKKVKKNKKGFTLIELLAVIIILGILLVIAVPAISRYIEDSRKNTYINAVKSIVTAVSTSVNALEYPFTPTKDQALIVPFSEASLEKPSAKIRSPYASYVAEKSYILITFDGNNYNYYVAALDEAGYGIPLVNDKQLSPKSITTDATTINNNIYSLSDIAATVNNGFVDTINFTMKVDSANDIRGNIIRTKLYKTPYNKGAIIQLKDGSKWQAIESSDENSETLNLVSYNHMETRNQGWYGQSCLNNAWASCTIRYDESAFNSIISATQVQLTTNGINTSGAIFKIPETSDFGCNKNRCPSSSYLSYLVRESNTTYEKFWTTEKSSSGSMVYVVTKEGIEQVTPGSTTLRGVRVVIKNLLKSNIDKTATKALN